MTPTTWLLISMIVFLIVYIVIITRRWRDWAEDSVERFDVLSHDAAEKIRDYREAVQARDAEIAELQDKAATRSTQVRQYAEENRRMREGFVFTARRVFPPELIAGGAGGDLTDLALRNLREDILKVVVDAGTIERRSDEAGNTMLVFRLKVHDLIERSPMTHVEPGDPILRDVNRI